MAGSQGSGLRLLMERKIHKPYREQIQLLTSTFQAYLSSFLRMFGNYIELHYAYAVYRAIEIQLFNSMFSHLRSSEQSQQFAGWWRSLNTVNLEAFICQKAFLDLILEQRRADLGAQLSLCTAVCSLSCWWWICLFSDVNQQPGAFFFAYHSEKPFIAWTHFSCLWGKILLKDTPITIFRPEEV